MKIGEVSKRTGVAASAIRYYEEQGLLEPSTRDVNGYRHYGEAAVARLILVRDAQRLGFSLDTIRGLFFGGWKLFQIADHRANRYPYE